MRQAIAWTSDDIFNWRIHMLYQTSVYAQVYSDKYTTYLDRYFSRYYLAHPHW